MSKASKVKYIYEYFSILTHNIEEIYFYRHIMLS